MPVRGSPIFHIVLHQPEIPNNTGNIGRTCVATGCALHLIHPLGFEVSEKACRRAGLDYWPRLQVSEHGSWESYLAEVRPPRLWVFHPPARGPEARKGQAVTPAGLPVYAATLRAGDHLVFGRETAGLPAEILQQHAAHRLFLPMAPGERSLNLATAVCAVVYEGIRQLLGRGDLTLDPDGRLGRGSPTQACHE
jgi:tRNA (cytidine/uridine-2'-O-)-methyltransferase